MAGFYADIVKKLKDDNWIKHREAKGSHEIWRSLDTNEKVIVPKNIKSRHTANGILKSANISGKV